MPVIINTSISPAELSNTEDHKSSCFGRLGWHINDFIQDKSLLRYLFFGEGDCHNT
jgi:hypothetical protein